MPRRIPVFDQVDEYHNCFVQILTNTKTGAVSIGWRPENVTDCDSELQMDMWPLLKKATLLIQDQQRIMYAMRNCTNCIKKGQCETVKQRKIKHADNYNPCDNWQFNMISEAGTYESAT